MLTLLSATSELMMIAVAATSHISQMGTLSERILGFGSMDSFLSTVHQPEIGNHKPVAPYSQWRVVQYHSSGAGIKFGTNGTHLELFTKLKSIVVLPGKAGLRQVFNLCQFLYFRKSVSFQFISLLLFLKVTVVSEKK